MSLHLLPIRALNIDSYPIEYSNYLPTVSSSTLYSCVTTLSHGMMYIGHCLQTGDFKLYKVNTITNAFSPVGDISWSDIGSRYVGAILVDDNFLYVSSINLATIRVYKLEDLSYVDSYQYSSSAFQAYGKMQWYNDTTICIAYDQGFLFFDTTTKTYGYKSQGTSYSFQDMCVGNDMVVATRNSADATAVLAYKPSTDEFTTFGLPSNDTAVVSYDKGLFYFVNKTYVMIYSETTGESTSVTGLWAGYDVNPRSVNVLNNCVFVTFCNSTRVYITDLTSSQQTYMNAHWTIPNWDSSREYIPCATNGRFYLPYITMLTIDFSGTYKYNIGRKYSQFSVIYNDANKSSFEYDPTYVTFAESYMTIVDGVLEYDMEEYNPSINVKSVLINKNNYGILKEVSLSRKEENDDGE